MNGIEYSQVCGRIIGGSQGGNKLAFGLSGASPTIDDAYLDGIRLTYGTSPCIHIWSFAMSNSW